MTIKSADLFDKMSALLQSHGADITKKVGAVFIFEIKPSKDKAPVLYTVDLKNGNGKWEDDIKVMMLLSESRSKEFPSDQGN